MTRRWFSSDETPARTTTRSPKEFVLLDNYYGPGYQSALGHRWICRRFPAPTCTSTVTPATTKTPMLLGPTDAVYDSAKAHGLSVRAYGERGLNTITPATATWTDMFNDWKNGTHNVNIAAHAVILGLRDIFTPIRRRRIGDPRPAGRGCVPAGVRPFEQSGQLPSLVLLLLYNDHTAGTSPGFPTPRAQVADNDLAPGDYRRDLAQPVLERLGHLRHRGRLAGRPGPRRRAPNGGSGDQPLHAAARGQQHILLDINMFRTIEQILGLPPPNQYALAAQPMFDVFTAKRDF